jgi:hypothetical protein
MLDARSGWWRIITDQQYYQTLLASAYRDVQLDLERVANADVTEVFIRFTFCHFATYHDTSFQLEGEYDARALCPGLNQ